MDGASVAGACVFTASCVNAGAAVCVADGMEQALMKRNATSMLNVRKTGILFIPINLFKSRFL
jgi:hypothetical protein